MPTLSHAHGPTNEPLLEETIGENLRRTAEQFPHAEALVVRHQNVRFTYRELWRATADLARSLLGLGVEKGDRVGVWAPNRYEWVLLQYATARVGAILVNINPAYKAFELEFALNQSGVKLLLLSKGFRQSDYTALLDQVRPRCPALKNAFVFETDWHALLTAGECVQPEQLARREASLSCRDAINIQYTSGTTGRPKGATLSHRNILNNGWLIARALGYTHADRVCISVPFYHCFGMVLGNLACTSTGACMIVPGESFDPLAVLETVQAERCTSLYGVPTMFSAEVDHPRFREFDLSSLRTGIMSGSPCPVELLKRVVADMHLSEITVAYGMTETAPVSTISRRDDPPERRIRTVGRSLPHVELKIIDPATGQSVAFGTSGELCCRGFGVMLGYWDNPAATTASIDAEGWMHSGDLATMDESGYVNIVGRLKDLIIRGGENISPREIEEFLLTHPGVSQAQVIGVPSEKYQEEVMAWVMPKPEVRLTSEELTAHCQGRIATFKIPRYWKMVEAFPMTVTGKVQKFRMREMSVVELGLEKAASIQTL